MGMYDDGPRVVIWEMTRACALACKHCRAEAIPRRDSRELTTHEAYKLVDDVAAATGAASSFLRAATRSCAPISSRSSAYAASRDLSVAVSPSGTGRVTKATLERLAASGCKRMSLSIDGPDAQVHDAFRGVKGTFDRTVGAAALRARRRASSLQINTTIARHNHTRIKEMAALVEKMDAAVWTAFFLVPTGRAHRDDCLDAAGFEEAFADLFEVWKTSPFMVKTTEAPHFRRYVAQHLADVPLEERPRERRVLLASRRSATAKASSSSRTPATSAPAVFSKSRAATYARTTLLEIYRNDPTFQRLRDVSTDQRQMRLLRLPRALRRIARTRVRL